MENRLENRKILEKELRSMKKKRRTVETSSTYKGETLGNVSSNSKKCENNLESNKGRNTETSTKRKLLSERSDSSKKFRRSTSSRQNEKHLRSENSNYITPVSSKSNCINKFKSSVKHNDKSYSPEVSYCNTPVSLSKFRDKFSCLTTPNFNGSLKNLYHSTPLSWKKYDRLGCSCKNNHDLRAVNDTHYNTPFSSRKYDRFKYLAKNDDDFDFRAVKGAFEADGYYNVAGKNESTYRLLDGRNIYPPKYPQPLKFIEKYKYFKNKMQKTTYSPYHYYAPKYSLYRLNQQRITKQLDYELNRYRWTKLPVTKEELDDEIDRYMSEFKFKPSLTTEKNDVDAFVQEYMLEVEKCQNQQDFINTFD